MDMTQRKLSPSCVLNAILYFNLVIHPSKSNCKMVITSDWSSLKMPYPGIILPYVNVVRNHLCVVICWECDHVPSTICILLLWWNQYILSEDWDCLVLSWILQQSHIVKLGIQLAKFKLLYNNYMVVSAPSTLPLIKSAAWKRHQWIS